MSHAESMRLFKRALIRANIPLRFSGGYNPRPKISLPFPRSVGLETCEDLLVAQMEQKETENASEIKERLQKQMPEYINLNNAEIYPGKLKSDPVQTAYYFYLKNLDLSKKVWIDDILARDKIIFERTKKKKVRKVNVREFISAFEHSDNLVKVIVKITPHGTVRVDELKELLNISEDDLEKPILRTDVVYKGIKKN